MPAKTIVALYDSFDEAHRVVDQLIASGIPNRDISLVANDRDQTRARSLSGSAGRTDSDAGSNAAAGAGVGAAVGGIGGLLVGLGALAIPGIGPVIAAGPLVATLAGAGIGAAAGGLIGALTGAGVPEQDAHTYAEGVRRGGALVTVRADDTQVDRVVGVLERFAPVDIDTRAAEYRAGGWTRFDETAGPYSETTYADRVPGEAGSGLTGAAEALRDVNRAGTSEREEHIPIVEEELAVGKREVERGRVRVRSYLVETPVNEQVTLRDENIVVERRSVDRDVEPGTELFQEQTIELTETDEEAVVAKQARVREELVVRKEVEERTETIRDTVRHTEVEIEGDDTTRRSTATEQSTKGQVPPKTGR